MDGDVLTRDSVDIRVGVLLPPSERPSDDEVDDDSNEPPGELDDTGHAPALGRRRDRAAAPDRRGAQLGQDVLRATAQAIGHEIGLVVDSVVKGLEQRDNGADNTAPQDGAFRIEDITLKFGVKATLGAGKMIEAFFTASGEATVEVNLTLRRPAH